MATSMAEGDTGSCDVVSEDPDETKSCGPCADLDVAAPGKKYCVDCQAYICNECVEIHKKFKHLKNHKLLDLSEGFEFDCIISDFRKYADCTKHPGRDVELYCEDDDVFLCLLCASTSHKNCRNVVEASEKATDTKQNIEELKQRIHKAQKHLNMLQEFSATNNNMLETKLDKFVQDVSDIVEKVCKTLGHLVEKVSEKTNQFREEQKDRELSASETVTRMLSIFDRKLVQLDYLSRFGSTSELCMGSEKLEHEVKTLEEELHVIDSTFEVAEPKLTILDELRKISERDDIDDMFTITMNKKQSEHIPKYSLKHHQPSPFEVGQYEKHTVSFHERCSPTFKGISMKDETHLVLSDSCSSNSLCGNLGFYNPNDKTLQKLKRSNSISAASLDKGTVALIQSSSKRISVLSIEFEITETLVDTKYQPQCIVSLRDGRVAISWSGPAGFSLADISGAALHESLYLTQDSEGRLFRSFKFMAIDEPRELVIQPCSKDKAVYCFDFKGKPVFKYTNGLESPRGVTVDSKGGSVFVCDMSSDCIHQLSINGQPIVVIRHSEMRRPLNVCYSKREESLWVTRNAHPFHVLLCLRRA